MRAPSIYALVAGAVIPFAAMADGGSTPLSFNEHIRPIFSDKCFACHGFDAKHRKADRRLDTQEGAYALLDGIQAIKPGDLEGSDAWVRIVSKDKDEVMPPEDSHKTLTEKEKAMIKRWIEEGATYQKHWAFEAPVKKEPPKVEGSRASHPIDSFIGDRLKRENLPMAPEADRETLIRRVSFATTGLPPTVKELDDFLGDSGDGAYERMVDRYLASPRYGEEMARLWLDVARYADTHGLHLDNERQMWAYRDWVVRAFNDNLPFDQFTTWQLAGDLLPNATRDQLIATGFNRCNVTTSEGGSINEEYIFRYAVDRASTTVETWMGLTAGCAVCHDHKYDPISTKEFYSIYAFFHSNADPAMDGNALLTKPTLKLASAEQDNKLKDYDGKLGILRDEINAKLTDVNYTDPATAEPPLPPKESETVWIEDGFPKDTKAQSNGGTPPTTWITAAEGGQVLSGQRSLKRSATEIAQDFYEGGIPFTVPVGARFFFNVYLDPADPPEAVMIQVRRGSWDHRAVWGNADLISYGTINTPGRHRVGDLPETSKWTRLEVDASHLGFKGGDQVTGVSFTLHGGTVYFDQMGVISREDAAADPNQSYLAWQKLGTGKDTQGVPAEINKLLKEGPKPDRKPEKEKQLVDYYLQYVCRTTKETFAPLVTKRDSLQKEREDYDKTIPQTYIWNDLGKPRDSFVMVRGQYDKPGDKVEPATLEILPPLQKANPEGRATRLDLAKWLSSPEHPLMARVTVNRLWQQFFGTGLVKTTFDFGSQGEIPSHPQLLDWLSVTFRENGWDVKKMVKLMLTSGTFRASSKANVELLRRDPENRLYARGPRFRLDAEQLRDNALAVSGLLNFEMGGKAARTYQPPNIWEPVGFVGSNTRDYTQDKGPALYRRSLYCFLKRTAPPPFMTNFDAPNREQSCSRRERSNTPLQALQLMNDVQHFEAARAFAERILIDGGNSAQDRIAFAYRTVLSRKPEAEEVEIVKSALDKHLARFQQDNDAAKKVITNGESKPRENLPPAEVA
ncbi:MAG TPA: PSD1 and planctomycete cytochrome C domain-containing protein, partial [Chthoniobacteraceae bacterium]|nr:PSD1 and planctomycete cytochrome C domain-containing protein [Chthoniobacteraceae bacterium]